MENEKKVKVVPCEIYTRVCGFFRPTMHFNKGKLAEYADRKTYDVKKSLEHK